MSQRHLEKGQQLPPLEKGKLRIYSMLFCPYAQRTRLVLAHKNIPHETVNVNLKRKPDWFFQKNPLGLVPTLEQDDKVVYESAICDDYLDEVYPNNRLLPDDPYEKARQRILMELFSKVTGPFGKIYYGKDLERADDLAAGLDIFEIALTSNFFGGDGVGMTDLHLWPWFERFDARQSEIPFQLLPADRYPKLNAWKDRMHQIPAVKATALTVQDYQAYEKSRVNGIPNYDILIDDTKS